MCEADRGMCPWWDPKRPAGFRFSIWDAVIVAVMAILTWRLWLVSELLVWLCPMTAGHFFLFCNVFRVGNRAELIWAIALLTNVAFWVFFGTLDWVVIMWIQAPVTIAVIVWAILQKDYHGFGWTLRRRCGGGIQRVE